MPPRKPIDATVALREEIETLRQKVADTEGDAARARLEAEEQAQAREAVEERLQREAEERAAWEKIAQEIDAEKAEVTNKLTALQAEAETTPRVEAAQLVEQGKSCGEN